MEKATERQKILLRHLNPISSSYSLYQESSVLSPVNCAAEISPLAAFGDDIVIVAAYRTAICKAKRGGFKDTLPDDLLASVLKAVVERTSLDPSEVGDIVVGTVLAPGSQRAMECRVAAYFAGFPDSVPIRTVNRQCSSGLQAVADVAASIRAGYYDIGIGAGVESMSIDHMAGGGFSSTNPRAQDFPKARDCLLPMGITSENVAERYGVTREEQDMAAVESHKRAAAAIASGKLKDEIVPVATKIVDPETKAEKEIVVSVDDGVRPNSNLADLAKLRTVFKQNGSTTAGNASQISDGAGAVLLMKRSLAMKKGLPILGVFRSFAVTGVEPSVMGIGPAVAIPAATNLTGLNVSDIDLFEINEVAKCFTLFYHIPILRIWHDSPQRLIVLHFLLYRSCIPIVIIYTHFKCEPCARTLNTDQIIVKTSSLTTISYTMPKSVFGFQTICVRCRTQQQRDQNRSATKENRTVFLYDWK